MVELSPHQLSAVDRLGNGKILCGGVGTGKSRTAIAYFYTKVGGGQLKISGEGTHELMTKPRDLYIITTAKKRDDTDWVREAAHFGLSPSPDAGEPGCNVVIDSWNNIGKYQHVTGAFFIFDEQRVVGSGAWVKAFLRITRRNRWILLSATPGDTWLDYVPVFVANGYYKNKTDFTRQHAVYNTYTKYPKIDRYVGTGRLIKLRRHILVGMPYERLTTRHAEYKMVEYDKALFDRVMKDRWHVYKDRPIKDVSEYFQLMRKVVNSDPSRLAMVEKLSEEHPKLIVFYNFDYELEALRTLNEIPWLAVAEWNGHKHEPIPNHPFWVYLVQYAAGAEGWNCVDTDAMVFYSLNYSYRATEQAKGRIDRLNTPFKDLWYYTLTSGSRIDMEIRKALSQKRDFNMVDFKV